MRVSLTALLILASILVSSERGHHYSMHLFPTVPRVRSTLMGTRTPARFFHIAGERALGRTSGPRGLGAVCTSAILWHLDVKTGRALGGKLDATQLLD